MSAVRGLMMRWIDVERPGVRAAVLLVPLCPAIFVCFFLVGRSTISPSAPSAPVAASAPVTYAGAAIPALRNAPPIEAIARGRPGNGGSSRPAPTPSNAATPVNGATQPEAARAPTPVSATQPEAPSAPTPTPAPSTPAPAHPSPPHKGGHVSFDTSG